MTRPAAAAGVLAAADGVLAVALAGVLLLSSPSFAQDHVHPQPAGGALPSSHSMDSRDLPGDEAHATERLKTSPRRAEWVTVKVEGGALRTWVVYPQRRPTSAVVVVVHDAGGLTDWVRNVADQLAAEGFIALAPDLAGAGSAAERAGRVAAVRTFGLSLPTARPRSAAIGFGAGGESVLELAAIEPGLDAAVAYDVPAPGTISLRASGAHVETETFAGAAAGFLRDQMGRDANMIATEKAWPRTIAFLRKYAEAPR